MRSKVLRPGHISCQLYEIVVIAEEALASFPRQMGMFAEIVTAKISDQAPVRTLIIELCWTHQQQVKMLGASTGRVHEFWRSTAPDDIKSTEATILVAAIF